MTSLANSFDQSAPPIARFNGDLSYRIDGDRAQLAADLAIIDQQSFDRQQCLLQLWACPSACDGNTPSGIKVAEQQVSAAGFDLAVDTLALPPAGRDDYVMVMTLVGIGDNGAMQLHDYANFEIRQSFIQPQLQGALNSVFADDHVDLAIECIRNPRAADNLSGSLSLELWALAEPYSGGAFSGMRLASTELGSLAGGEEWLHNSFRLDLAPRPAGEWSLVLMLREWTAAGYLTRDYRSLQAPAVTEVVEPTPVVEAVDVAPVVEVTPAAEAVDAAPAEVVEAVEAAADTAVVEEAVEVPQASLEASAEADEEAVEVVAEAVEADEKVVDVVAEAVEADEKVVEAVAEAVEADEKAVEVVAEAVEADEKVVEAVAEKVAKAPVKEAANSDLVSINDASAADLVKVKGISRGLASAIVAGRPYGRVDDLLKIRGIGQRSLERLRPFLGL